MMKQAAIVIAAYNRPESLARLLNSLARADYGLYKDIDLVISIDGGGNKLVHEVSQNFIWSYGRKQLLVHEENIGLHDHLISCGNLTGKYGNIILLEDDLMVSRNFYTYACRALEYYENDNKIAGIGLYSYHYNETALLPFRPLDDGNEVYFLQHPCSWGQAWTEKQWAGFIQHYTANLKISNSIEIPDSVRSWPESSWKKYFAAYMVESNSYFVYPQFSYTTNFADPGENWSSGLAFFQVPLEHQANPEYTFTTLDAGFNIYDAYFEILTDCLIKLGAGIDPDTCVDIYGKKPLQYIKQKYLISSKICNSPIKQYGTELKPLLQNIIQNAPGQMLAYAQTDDFSDRLSPDIYHRIWEKQHAQGYYAATKTIHYKLGFYLLNPFKYIKKRWRNPF